MTAARDRLCELVTDLAVVHGTVTLASGKQADYYVDLRRITLHHEAAPLVGTVMLDLLADSGLTAEAVGGLTMGADPVAAAMLHAAAARGQRLDAFVVRKEASRTACNAASRVQTSRVGGWSPLKTPPPPAGRFSPPSPRCVRPAPR
jgi:orotate phosphoribosyltransferase